MNFEEAEARFRELQARVQRGEPISRAEYEDQVSQLAVQDRNGVLWEINPRTGKWMYFDGAEWVSGTPPGHDTSAVIPAPGKFVGPPGATTQPVAAPPTTPPPAPSITTPTPPPPPPILTPPPPPAPRPVSTPVPPRPITPPTVGAPAGPKAAPEPLKPLVRPPSKPSAPPPPGGQPERTSPLAMFGPNREWVPLAIGAVVLLLCAVLLIGVSQFVTKLGAVQQPTATRTLVPTLPSTPIPTVVRLPTLPPPTATPSVVLATVSETRVNVRSSPSTKAKIISSLKKGNSITLVGRTADNTWYQINIAGAAAPGWVFAQTIQISSGDPDTLPEVGPTPTPTKSAAAPRPAQPTPTATQAPLGTLPSPTP